MPAAAPAEAGGREAAAAWRAIGTSVHLLVTDLRALAAARRLLTEDPAVSSDGTSGKPPASRVESMREKFAT